MYDLEDVIETYSLKVVSTKKRGVKNVLKRFACILKEGVNIHRIGKETENITTKISELRSCLQKYNIKEINPCNWRTTRLSTTTNNAKVISFFLFFIFEKMSAFLSEIGGLVCVYDL